MGEEDSGKQALKLRGSVVLGIGGRGRDLILTKTILF
jgi:hypothetical protein